MKNFNPNIHHRKSIRLKGYDYSQAGFYFITIVTQNRNHLFGEISNQKMNLNDAGKMIKNEWLKISNRFENTKLHEYIIMPNHFHSILEIVGATLVVAPIKKQPQMNKQAVNGKMNGEMENDGKMDGQPQGIAPTDNPTDNPTTDKTVGDIIGAFKSITSNEYIRGVKNNNWQRFEAKLWQRNYWEHIIRNENEYNRIAQYIINNPQKWGNDKLNGGNGNIVMESIAEYNSEIWMV
jgi:REP element-mobilizing transposase RayT